jgi:hypothetical protein
VRVVVPAVGVVRVECSATALITRVPGRNQYTLTPDGLPFAVFYTKVHDRSSPPARRPRPFPRPPELRADLRTNDTAIHQRLAHARLGPAS